MRNADLQMAINSPKLKRVLAHWHEARGHRLMPIWQDIRPAKIKTELSIVWSYHYDALQDDFLGGIAGDAIQRLLGGPIKNAQFRQVHDAEPHFFHPSQKRFCLRRDIPWSWPSFSADNRPMLWRTSNTAFWGWGRRAGGIFGQPTINFAHLYASGPEVCGEVETGSIWRFLRLASEQAFGEGTLSQIRDCGGVVTPLSSIGKARHTLQRWLLGQGRKVSHDGEPQFRTQAPPPLRWRRVLRNEFPSSWKN